MPNPGAFSGKRFLWLTSKISGYVDAYKANKHKAKREEILRGFFRRFPVKYPDDWEPTDEEFDAVDDNAPVEEELTPTFNSPEEKEAWDVKQHELGERYKAVKGTVTRWLDYRSKLALNNGKKTKGKDNRSPAERIVRYLTGESDNKPRKIPASRLWARDCPEAKAAIREEYDKQLQLWREDKVGDKEDKSWPARTYAQIVNEHWDKLSGSEQREWGVKSKELLKEEMKQWEDNGKKGFSTDPKERQRCINILIGVTQEFIDLTAEACGWEVCTIMGGPEPADKGRINIVSIHLGPKNRNFGTVMRSGVKKQILPLFGEYLKLCFTKAECKARALDVEDAVEEMGLMDMGSSLEIFNVDDGTFVGSKSSTSKTSSNATTTSLSTAVAVPPVPSAPSNDSVSALSAPSNDTVSVTTQTLHHLTAVSPPRSHPLSPALSRPASPMAISPPASPTMPATLQTKGTLTPTSSTSEVATKKDASTTEEVAPVSERGRGRGGARGRGGKRKAVQPSSSRKKARTNVPEINESVNVDDWGAKADDCSTTPPFNEVMQQLESLEDEKLSIQSLPVPAHGPQYLINCVEMFNSCDDPVFRVLCHKWLLFEWRRRLLESTKLPSTTSRPAAVGDWIARARPVAWRPSIHAEVYSFSFEDWYHTLQPGWRDQVDGKWERLNKPAKEWARLCHSGANGFVNLLAALFFWHHGIEDMPVQGFRERQAKEKIMDSWRYYTSDVCFMLEGLLK
ncbi:SERTA domain-containing protein 3 [Stygiomarasmius scandens]|uniref:SERTA domain-containing protein 3 n=1 Tax=Marasmiellus scandens TaxID=2682957 RepID=A0ABR1IKJ5_9AGAR